MNSVYTHITSLKHDVTHIHTSYNVYIVKRRRPCLVDGAIENQLIG